MKVPMIPLRVRSNYSLCAGGSSIESLVAAAKALGFRALALTDVDGLYGADKFFATAKAAGLTPLIGAQTGKLTLLTRSREGYANLCAILSRRHLGRPCDVAEFQKDLHFITEDPATAASLQGRVDRLWMELVRPGRSVTHEITVLESARAMGLPLVASLDVRFATPADARALEVLTAIHGTTALDRIEPVPRENYLRHADFSDIDDRSDEVAADAAWDFLPAPVVFPSWEGAGAHAAARLRGLCEAGLERRYQPVPREARDRLERELSVITKLGFSEYFLVVHEIVRAAREKGAPLAGRGSGASSLAAYVLGITNVCPLRYKLQFERFLHEGRADYPDLDLDFCWRTRDSIIDYAFERFGRDRVAMVSSHVTFQMRGAFREAARVHGLSDEQIARVRRAVPIEFEAGTGGLPERWLNRLPIDADRFRAIVTDARRILNYPHHLSVHPGGIVIGKGPMERHAPLQMAEKGVVVTQFDKDGVEAVGLVKIDLLGNRAVSTVRAACDLLGGLDPERIPDHDAQTVELLRAGRTIGVNQMESPAMRHLLLQMRPNGVADVMKSLALIRPGAASVGGKDNFIKRHRGIETWTVHPKLAPALGETYGVMLYEDDAMLVAAALAGLPLADGDRFRKRIQKVRTDEQRLALSREFLALCAAAGTPADLAKELWVQMAKFNDYSFCMSHAASYAQLAYAAAWLRTHHPLEFWVAALNNNQGMYEKRVYVEEARRGGIRTLLPDVNRSGVEFSAEGGAIRTGLGSVTGLERRAIESILEKRPFDSLFDFVCRVEGASQPSVKSLIFCGALDFLARPRPEMALELQAVWRRRKPVKPPRTRDLDERERSLAEYGILGLSPGPHLLELLWPGHRSLVKDPGDAGHGGGGPHRSEKDLLDSRAIPARTGKPIRLAGVLDALRLADTNRGETMEFVSLEDEHGVFECTLFPQVYRRFAAVARDAGPYVVDGVVDDHYGSRTITASRIERRTPAAQVPSSDVARTGRGWAVGQLPHFEAMKEALS
jgi:DNA-directed DNA polymerase III PolC